MADRGLANPPILKASKAPRKTAARESSRAAGREPRKFTTWGVALAGGWLAFAVLMFVPVLWVSPSYLWGPLSWLYNAVTELMPRWFATRAGAVPNAGATHWPVGSTLDVMRTPPGWYGEEQGIGELLRRWSATLLYFGLMGSLWVCFVFALRSVAREVGSRVREWGEGEKEAGIRDQGSGIRDQGSGIRDQGSGIRDREAETHPYTTLSGYRMTRSPRSALVIVLIGWFVFSAITMLWMGLLSSDVFDYAIQGKMQVLHGLNPFVDPPRLMKHEPFLDLTPWRDKLTVYGPAMLLVVKLVTYVAEPLGGEPVTYMLLYRAINVALIAICTLLVWDIGKRLEWPKERLAVAVVMFAWCPLMISELVGSAHNDGLLILCVLGAIWLHIRGWWPLAMQALVIGGMVKLSGYFLLPAYIVLLARTSHSWGEAARRVAGAFGVVMGVAVFAFSPYFHPDLVSSLVSNPMSGFVVNSPAAAVRTLVVNVLMELRGIVTPADLDWRPALELARQPMWFGPILLWALMMIIFSVRARDLNSLIRAWFLVLFSYLIVGSVWNWPWYANWLVPLMAVMPASPLRRAGLLLVFGSAMCWGLYPIGSYLPGHHAQRLSFLYMPAVIFGPALIYLAWIWWQFIFNWWRGRVRAPRLRAAEAKMG